MKNLKLLASSALVSLIFAIPQHAAAADSADKENPVSGNPITVEHDGNVSHQEEFAFLFDKPEGIIELPATFGIILECAEVLTQEEAEAKVREVTTFFMEKKNRKELPYNSEDVFTNVLRTKDIPITYLTGLSIDGGGTRGLIPALLIEELSHKLSKPLCHYFDYIGGTSIGGILALGLTAPDLGENSHRPRLEVNDLVRLFYDRGQDIFPSATVERSSFNVPMRLWDSLRHLVAAASSMFASQYGVQGLEGLLKEKFGERAFLHETLTNTLITALDTGHIRSQTYLFDSRNAKKLRRNDQVSIPLWKVGRSTSAAPTYFPAYKLNIEDDQGYIHRSHTLVDGGLWLNNPSTLVAKALLNFASEESLFASQKNIVMLSLGTGYAATNRQLSSDTGTLNAVVPLIDTLMNVSSSGTHESLQEILGRGNYQRINPQLQNEIKLDATDRAQLDLLKEAAEGKYEDIQNFIDGSFRRILEQDEFRYIGNPFQSKL